MPAEMTGAEPASLKVVEAVHRDIPGIHTFILDAWMVAGPSAWGWSGATEENVQELASSEHLAKLISDSKVKIFLARDKGRIVGLAATRELDSDVIELAGIIVSENDTGRGVGTALAVKAVEVASDLGYKEAIVKTETFNKRAMGFYKANGFVQSGTAQEDVDGTSINLAVLKRSLK